MHQIMELHWKIVRGCCCFVGGAVVGVGSGGAGVIAVAFALAVIPSPVMLLSTTTLSRGRC
eukprot:10626290-Alexandrium_andersonii.AAC.1